jgi:hypothetical protein
MESRPMSDLDDLTIKDSGDKIEVYIRAFSNAPFSQQERLSYINRLAGHLSRKPESISLQVLMIPTAQRESPSTVAEATPTPATIAQLNSGLLQRIKDAMVTFSLPEPAEMIDFELSSTSAGNSRLLIHYLSSRGIDVDGRVELQKTVRNLLSLQTLTLSFNRISSEATNLPFELKSAEFDTESDEITGLVDALREYPALKVRMMLAKSSQDQELHEKRKAALTDYLVSERGFNAERIVFTEGDESKDINTFQLFLK